jgi:Ran GTPase-activating protein (RanGAP) involved in mRNA processing and transport
LQEYEVAPRPELCKIFDTIDPGAPLEMILQGNAVGMFTTRLDDVEVIAVVQTILSIGLKNLEHLDLRYHKISDAGATAISLLFQDAGDYTCALKSICLQGNDITESGCAKICMNLTYNSSIVDVNLNGNPLGNEGGMALAQMLSKNNTLQKLDIGNTELGTESVVALATVMKTNASITHLNMENPRLYSLQEESTVQICKMLQVNSSLRELNIAKHCIRDYGARILAQNLLDNATLQVLNLRCNDIGIGGGEALAALLIKSGGSGNTSLVELNLASNRISNDGAFAFGAALRHPDTQIGRLDLSKNSIEDEGLVAVARGMEDNQLLAQLRLWGNKFDQPSMRCFHDLFDGRFKYLDLDCDFKTYIVDGDYHIAQV